MFRSFERVDVMFRKGVTLRLNLSFFTGRILHLYVLQTVIALVRCIWSGRTRPPLKKRQSGSPKQDIALFFHSSTMTMVPLK